MRLTATVDRIISVTPHDISEWECDVLCTDGQIRKLSNYRDSDNIKNLEEEIKQGFQFDYEIKIPPHCISTDYKLIYETIDKALQDSIDNILGKVMTALSGRVNPEEARKIIIDRLLLNKI